MIDVLMYGDMLQQVDHLMRSVFGAPAMPMDTYRRGDKFIAEFDLPGVDRDAIEVTIEGDVLQVSARRDAHTDDVDSFGVRERMHGKMTRRILLSDRLDRSKIDASYVDGVLRVVIPLAEDAKPRVIEVTSGTRDEQAAVGAGTTSETTTADREPELVGAAA